jgi:hypothetical protein
VLASNGLVKKWKEEILDGDLIRTLWDLEPIYVIADAKEWDDKCADRIYEIVQDDEALDSITLMMFGGNNLVGLTTLDTTFGAGRYIDRVQKRLTSPTLDKVEETVKTALIRATGRLPQ